MTLMYFGRARCKITDSSNERDQDEVEKRKGKSKVGTVMATVSRVSKVWLRRLRHSVPEKD